MTIRNVAGVTLMMLVVVLALLPLTTAFNDWLTRLLIAARGYRLVSEVIVPLEIKWVVVVLRALGVDALATSQYVLLAAEQRPVLVELIWNCVGWQSLVMFLITAVVGLSRSYTAVSRAKALLLGVLGTISVNVLRIVGIILLLQSLGQGVAIVFHDYGALLTNTVWLLVFWKFAEAFLLVAKEEIRVG